MAPETQHAPAITVAQYRATLDRFAEQRAQLDDQMVTARQRGETIRAANLYRYWQQIVAEQRQFLVAHVGK